MRGLKQCAYKTRPYLDFSIIHTPINHRAMNSNILRDLSRCNDIVNAVSNKCTRLVECADGSIVLTTHEPKDVNYDAQICQKAVSADNMEDQSLPRVFTEKFKGDLMGCVFDKCIPWVAKENERAVVAMCRAVLPRLTTVRSKLRQRDRKSVV